MTLDLDNFAPVQLDAGFGVVSALQEMLFRCSEGGLFLLPALPERMETGSVCGLVFPEGTVDLQWDKDGVQISITAEKDFTIPKPTPCPCF